MAWFIPAAIGAALGAAVSKGGRKGGIRRISTLTPEQESIMRKLAPWVEERIGKGLPRWTGEWVAEMSPYEEVALGRLGEYLASPTPDITEYGLGKYREALSGMSPGEVYDWYMKYIAPEERRYMQQEIIPRIREEYIPSGNFYGTPRFEEVGRAWEKFGTQQLGRIGQAIMAEREAARRMLPLLPTMTTLAEGAPLRRAEAGLRLGALPRLLEQERLNREIQEFIRTTPELSPIIDRALQLLGIQTQAAYYSPYQPSPLMQVLGAVAPAVGSYLGSQAIANAIAALSG